MTTIDTTVSEYDKLAKGYGERWSSFLAGAIRERNKRFELHAGESQSVCPTTIRASGETAPEPEGPEAASRKGGGGGIRTHKPVRAPHFESRA